MPPLYPIFADLADRPVLVVGGGRVASRKVRSLVACGARVTVVAHDVCAQMDEVAEGLTVCRRSFEPADLDGVWLVVAATDDAELNSLVYREATGRRILCNVVDQPQVCSFHVPAVVRRGLLQVAVSTGGASPAMARRLRERIESEFGPEYGPFLEALLELRNHWKAKHAGDEDQRRRLLESFIDEAAPEALSEQADPEALRRCVEQWKSR